MLAIDLEMDASTPLHVKSDNKIIVHGKVK